jgi:hypothetical protein
MATGDLRQQCTTLVAPVEESPAYSNLEFRFLSSYPSVIALCRWPPEQGVRVEYGY